MVIRKGSALKESENKVEEAKIHMKRIEELISVSKQFGEWGVDRSNFTEEENAIIRRAEEIANKHGIYDEFALIPEAVFIKLSAKERSLILQALEIFVHHLKYFYHGGMKLKKDRPKP